VREGRINISFLFRRRDPGRASFLFLFFFFILLPFSKRVILTTALAEKQDDSPVRINRRVEDKKSRALGPSAAAACLRRKRERGGEREREREREGEEEGGGGRDRIAAIVFPPGRGLFDVRVIFRRVVTRLPSRRSRAKPQRTLRHGDCIVETTNCEAGARRSLLPLHARLFHLTRFYGPIKRAYKAQYITRASRTTLTARLSASSEKRRFLSRRVFGRSLLLTRGNANDSRANFYKFPLLCSSDPHSSFHRTGSSFYF